MALQADSYFKLCFFIRSVALSWSKLYQVPFGLCRISLSVISVACLRDGSQWYHWCARYEVTGAPRLFVPWCLSQSYWCGCLCCDSCSAAPREGAIAPFCRSAPSSTDIFLKEYGDNVHKHQNIETESEIPSIAHSINCLGLFREIKLIWGHKIKSVYW